MRYHFTPSRMAILKRRMITSVGEDVEKLELLHTTSGDGKWHSHFGKQVSSSSKS